MTKRNNPKVTTVTGNVNSINNGFTVIRNKASTIATIIAEK